MSTRAHPPGSAPRVRSPRPSGRARAARTPRHACRDRRQARRRCRARAAGRPLLGRLAFRHRDPEVHRRVARRRRASRLRSSTGSRTSRLRPYRSRAASTCSSSPQATIEARWTNSCGAVPTVGRYFLSASTSHGRARDETRPVAGHRGALAQCVEDDDIGARSASAERRRRRLVEPELAVGLVRADEEVVLLGERARRPSKNAGGADGRRRIVRVVDPDQRRAGERLLGDARRDRGRKPFSSSSGSALHARAGELGAAFVHGIGGVRHEHCVLAAAWIEHDLGEAEDRLLAAVAWGRPRSPGRERHRTAVRTSPRSPRGAPATPPPSDTPSSRRRPPTSACADSRIGRLARVALPEVDDLDAPRRRLPFRPLERDERIRRLLLEDGRDAHAATLAVSRCLLGTAA